MISGSDGELGGCQRGPLAHKSDASRRTLRSLLRKNMADKNDSGGGGLEDGGEKYSAAVRHSSV